MMSSYKTSNIGMINDSISTWNSQNEIM